MIEFYNSFKYKNILYLYYIYNIMGLLISMLMPPKPKLYELTASQELYLNHLRYKYFKQNMRKHNRKIELPTKNDDKAIMKRLNALEALIRKKAN